MSESAMVHPMPTSDQFVRSGQPRRTAPTREELRRFVHKEDATAVLLTEVRDADERFIVFGASWPTAHAYYRVEHEGLDLLLVAETLRQATIAAAHLLFDVPIGWSFLMDRMVVSATRTRSTFGGKNAAVEVTVAELSKAGGHLQSMTSRVTFWVDGERVGEGEGFLRVLAPRVYERLRMAASPSHSAPTLADAHPVGSAIALSPRADGSGHTWDVRISRADPFFFDHPVDHMPGIVLFAAIREAVHRASREATVDWEVASFDGTFTRFIELDSQLSITVTLDGWDGAFRVGRASVSDGLGSAVFARFLVSSAEQPHHGSLGAGSASPPAA